MDLKKTIIDGHEMKVEITGYIVIPRPEVAEFWEALKKLINQFAI